MYYGAWKFKERNLRVVGDRQVPLCRKHEFHSSRLSRFQKSLIFSSYSAILPIGITRSNIPRVKVQIAGGGRGDPQKCHPLLHDDALVFRCIRIEGRSNQDRVRRSTHISSKGQETIICIQTRHKLCCS